MYSPGPLSHPSCTFAQNTFPGSVFAAPVGGNPSSMTSNRLKLIFAGAGVGAVVGMAGLTVVNSTALADPALPEPTVPGTVTEAPAEGPTLEAETPTYTTTSTTVAPAP